MFGWFAPRCPLDTAQKAWVEWRMRWLVDRFGLDRLRSARLVLPTDEFFPDPYDGDEASARRCFERVCGYMGVPPESVSLEVLDDEQMPGAAGLYEQRAKSNVCVARSQLADPTHLLATLAHELAHELLLKGGHLTRDTSDHEQVTDLLPVALGVGVFAANATLATVSYSVGTATYWEASRQGYLSSVTIGYALAVWAYVRGEDRPAWAGHLRTDAAVTLRTGLRYLRKTADCLLQPDTAGTRSPATVAVVREQLADRSPTVRLAALWDVPEHGLAGADLLPDVERCLADPDLGVSTGAVQALGEFGRDAERAVPVLIELAWNGHPEGQAAAAYTLGRIGDADANVIRVLATLLSDQSNDVATAAAGGLGRLGPGAASAEPQLLAAVEAAAAVTHPVRLNPTLAALRQVCTDPRGRLKSHFAGRDSEALQLALGVLRDMDRADAVNGSATP